MNNTKHWHDIVTHFQSDINCASAITLMIASAYMITFVICNKTETYFRYRVLIMRITLRLGYISVAVVASEFNINEHYIVIYILH